MNKWIKVSEELPREIIDYVLVGRAGEPDSAMEANYVDGKFIVHRYGMMTVYVNPTHWLPYPEAPPLQERKE